MSNWKKLFSILFIIFAAVFSIYQLKAPKAEVGNVPMNKFSSERAFSYLENFATRPHPSNSLKNQDVGNYIFEQLSEFGIKPEIQSTTSVDTQEGNAMPVQNIVARIPGTDSAGTILFVSHYDSVPMGPGASDNGVAVASQMETARALMNNAPLKNDVVFLFTDGEETFSGGAKTFIDESPIFKNVSMVFNFESRGVSGPVLMFETTPKNSGIISDFAKTAPSPMAFSFLDEIYKQMPNGTDFSYFKDKNVQGLNFAFAFKPYYYHTALDNIQNVSKDTMGQDGQYMVSLANYYGNGNKVNPDRQDSVYSNVLGLFFFHYSQNFALVFIFLLIALFLFFIIRYLKQRIISLKQSFFGLLAFLLTTIVATVLALLVYFAGSWLSGKNLGVFVGTYSPWIYFLVVILISLFVFVLFYNFKWIKRIGISNLTIGAFFTWFLLAVFSTFYLPGLSYLFVWPLLFGLIIFELIIRQKERGLDWLNLGIILVLVIPILALFIPFAYLLFVAMGMMIIPGISLLVALLLGLFIPFIFLFSFNSKLKLPILALLILTLLLFATFYSAFNETNHPRQDGIVYVQNFNVNKSYWVSEPGQPIDKYISEYLGNYRMDTVPDLLDMKVPVSDAPWLTNQIQNISLVDSETVNDTKTYNLKVDYDSLKPLTQIILYSKSDINSASLVGINNKSYDITQNLKSGNGFIFANPPEGGFFITIKAPKDQKLNLEINRMIYGIPDSLYKPRPGDVITYSSMDSSFFIQDFSF